MTTLATSMDGVLDALLDQLQRRRERVMAAAPNAHRAARIAELYEQQARVWSLLFERSRSRLCWRAALSAKAYARSWARAWRAQAAACRCNTGTNDRDDRWDAPAAEAAGCGRSGGRKPTSRLAPACLAPAVVLTCCDCGRSFEPSAEDFHAGRTGCPDPDCGGWTLRAQLIEPATAPDRHERGGECLP